MAVRRKTVWPDSTLQTREYGEVAHVSDQAFLEAVVAAAQAQIIAGGTLSVLIQRHPTDVVGESVTTLAMVEWNVARGSEPIVREPRDAGLFESTEPPQSETLPFDGETEEREDGQVPVEAG